MPRMLRWSLIWVFAVLLLPRLLAAQCTSSCITDNYDGVDGPATYRFCVPQPSSCYNGNVVLFFHGFVPPGAPAGTWESQLMLPDGTSIPDLVTRLGFGFGASSYSKDGLAVLQGIEDTKKLTELFTAKTEYPVNGYFAIGASDGGPAAVKSLELYPETYRGGVSVCGPIGNFRQELNYFGDLRVLFDYFFPGVLTTGTPGESAIQIPPALIFNWASFYEPRVRQAIRANPLKTFQLVSTANLPIGLNFRNAEDAIVGVLGYNIFGTNDARLTLGGNPFDNIGKVYRGSLVDFRLNRDVARFAADPAALANLNAYETTGLLGIPLVTLHNLWDPIAPYWHETLYAGKARATGSSSELAQIPVLRYGHCEVNATEATAAFLLMLLKTGL